MRVMGCEAERLVSLLLNFMGHHACPPPPPPCTQSHSTYVLGPIYLHGLEPDIDVMIGELLVHCDMRESLLHVPMAGTRACVCLCAAMHCAHAFSPTIA